MKKILILLFSIFLIFCLKPVNALTSVGNTFVEMPFSPNQRAICRDDAQNIHVVWLYNSTTVRYARSSDEGNSFDNFKDFNYPSNLEKGTPHISCEGKRIIVVFSTNASSLVIYNSSDWGNSWSYQELRSGYVNSKSTVVAEMEGNNIYVAYESFEDINLFNSTNGGDSWGEDMTVFDGYSDFDRFIFIKYYNPNLILVNGIVHIVAISRYSEPFGGDRKLVYKNSINWTEKIIRRVSAYMGGPGTTMDIISPLVSYSNWMYISYEIFVESQQISQIEFSFSQDYGNSWPDHYYISNPAFGNSKYPSIALDTENLPIVFWQENNMDIAFRKYDGVSWIPESRFKLTDDEEINDTFPNAKAISDNLIELVWKRGNEIVYDSFSILFQEISLKPGENIFEIISPIALRSFKIVGDRKYLNIFWQAEYLQGWKKEIAIRCYLNCPYTDITKCGNYQNCSSSILSSYQGICTIPEPQYDFTKQNSLTCELSDPSFPSVRYVPQVREFWPLYFSSSPLKNISATVGDRILISINVKNLGLLTDNYTVNVTPLNNQNLVSIDKNLIDIKEVKTNETKAINVKIVPLFSTDFNLGIWVYSQSPEWFDCNNCPNGFICEESSNKCAKYFELEIKSGYSSL
ncbi:MAG: hypothetical protein QW140_01015, partial [Candidatus Aenigmatarchaeota archaeon]